MATWILNHTWRPPLGPQSKYLHKPWQAGAGNAEAVALLRRDLARFGGTSIRFRIRKNLNLLTMEGQRPPELDAREWIGSKPRLLRKLCGRLLMPCAQESANRSNRFYARQLVPAPKSQDRHMAWRRYKATELR